MIPSIDLLTTEITEPTYSGRTYKINFNSDIRNQTRLGLTHKDELTILSKNKLSTFTIDENGVVSISYNVKLSGNELSQNKTGALALTMNANLPDADRISGYIDDLEAVIQAIYLILSTERYQHIIYSWDYGVELLDLFGMPFQYVMCELPRRVKEALIQDDRIVDVTNFEFEKQANKLHATFTVISNVGNISTALEVNV